MHPLSRLAAFALLAAPASAGSFSVFLGPPGGTGFVRVFDDAGVALPVDPPELDGIRLLPLDVSNRAALEELSSRCARRRDDVPGAARLSLPQGRGSLYHYVRGEGTPAEAFGFFVVDVTRVARVVFELPSPSLGVDPFIERIAAAPDGDALLLGTARAAGGDLYEVDLAQRLVLLHSAGIGPLDLRGRGLTLQAGFGAAVHKTGILRFVRGVAADALPVPFAAGEYPVWFERAVVSSGNGEWIATVAGESPHLTYPYVFGATGGAQRMTQLAADLAGAGLAPEAPNGPWLAVSDDGCACAWRIRDWGPWDDAELYFGTRPAPNLPATAEHVTRDGLFAPYLDEVGVFVFRPNGSLVFVAGDPAVPGVNLFEEADAFRLERLPSGALGYANLTGTSGETLPPFDFYGTLEPTRLVWVESAASYLMLAREGTEDGLFVVDGAAGGMRALARQVNRLDLVELAPQHVVLSLLTPPGSAERGLVRLPLDLATDPELLLPYPFGTRAAHGTLGAGGQCAVGLSDGLSDALWSLDITSGAATPFALHGLEVGPLLDVTRNGLVLATLGSGSGGTAATVWDPGQQAVRIQSLPAGGLVLPGP